MRIGDVEFWCDSPKYWKVQLKLWEMNICPEGCIIINYLGPFGFTLLRGNCK